jgi:hypothetical protein
MKTLFLFSSLLFFFSLHALDLNTLELHQVRGQFAQGQGQMDFDKVYVKTPSMTVSSRNSNISLGKMDSTWSIQSGDWEFQYSGNLGGSFDSLSFIDIDSLDLSWRKSSSFALQTTGMAIRISDGLQKIPKLSVLCGSGQKSLQEEIDLCIHYGRLSIPIIDIDQVNQKALGKALSVTSSSLKKLENLSLKVDRGQYYLQFKAKVLFKLTIKVQGQMLFQEEQNRLAMKVVKAKAGWLSIKRTLLKQIKQAGFSNIKVSGDWIYISI